MQPLPQLVPARVQGLIERIRESIWFDAKPVQIAQGATTTGPRPLADAIRASVTPIEPPFHWGRLFQYTWFKVSGLSPDRHPRWLRWRDQGEAILYVDYDPYYGLDVAHRHAPLPKGCRQAWVQSICCQSAIWHPSATGLDPTGSRFDGAETVRRNERAWTSYHDLLVLQELALEYLRTTDPVGVATLTRPGRRTELSSVPPRFRRLLTDLDRAADAYESGGLEELAKVLAGIYRNMPADRDALSARVVGHAHVDLVWLWPEPIGATKAVHTFATVDRLLKDYPEFRFSYSQPASYEAVASLEPGLSRRVAARRRAGQWEATGAMFVESDTLLPCGEALLRSFQLGQSWFIGENDRAAKTLWLPDVFGYSSCLPQLARMSGVDSFFTNKITWNRISVFPHSSFVWRGADGSELISHVSHDTENFYNGAASVKELQAGARDHRQSDIHREFLAPTGYGDGGGGPTEEMCERVRRLANLAGVPKARWGHAEEFYAKLAGIRARLPVWTGEIYLEYHRGVFTTHGDFKVAFRAAERGLQTWEAAHCATRKDAIDDEKWKRLVFAQFHDAIPGSAIHEVYAELRPELQQLAADALKRTEAILTTKRGVPCRFNPLPIETSFAQVRGKDVWQEHLRPLHGAAVASATVEKISPVVVRDLSLHNGIVEAVFTRFGELSDLRVRGQAVALSGPAAQITVCPDSPHAFDAWEIDRHSLQLGRRVSGQRTASRAISPAEGMIEFSRNIRRSKIITRYRLKAGSPVLEVDYELDWREPRALLKLLFPTGYRGQMARFGAPYGSVLREQWSGKPAAEAQWEVPGSRWALVTDDGEDQGLMLITEAKYGFGCRDGVLNLSLLKSAAITGEAGKFARAVPRSLRTESPSAGMRHADIGRHRIRIAVGLWRNSNARGEMPAALADKLFTPPMAYRGAPVSAGLLGMEGGDSLVPAWAKPLDGKRWLLRLHETMGRRGAAKLLVAGGWRVRGVGVLDRPLGLRSAIVDFVPYQVVSVILERSG